VSGLEKNKQAETCLETSGDVRGMTSKTSVASKRDFRNRIFPRERSRYLNTKMKDYSPGNTKEPQAGTNWVGGWHKISLDGNLSRTKNN